MKPRLPGFWFGVSPYQSHLLSNALQVDEVVRYIEARNEQASVMTAHLQRQIDDNSHDEEEEKEEEEEEEKEEEEEEKEEDEDEDEDEDEEKLNEQEEAVGLGDETKDGESAQLEDRAEELEEAEEEEVEVGEESLSEDHPTRRRDEAKWQESAWPFEWMALTAWASSDYLLLQGELAQTGFTASST
jgi:flagellar biosynthesis GTPase FlhF